MLQWFPSSLRKSTSHTLIYKICFFLPSSFPSSILTLLYTPASLSLGFINFPRNSPGQNAGMGSLSFLQGIFPTQVKPRSPTLQMDSLPAEPQGKPKNLEWVAYPFFSGSSWPRNQTGVSCIAGRFFTNWAIREAPLSQGFTHIVASPGMSSSSS